ncbi:MAG TPA: CbtA family protein [Sporichthyaceae bacterium]|jgi:predicted cobalt transporter CbtA|nr:CbtA family protein [Sporichthyaceae bacterium]
MEKRLVGRGLLAGGIAGLIAFIFARIFAEPVIQRAIDYESARDDAMDALNKAAGLPVDPAGPDIFSRHVQRNVGIGVGMIAFGIAMGAIVAVVFALCLGRTGKVRPKPLALLVAAAGYVTVYLVPFAKYPANPPAIGHEETIRTRASFFLTMMLTSVVCAVIAVWLGRRLALRLGTWNASLVAGIGYLAVMGIVMALLPDLGRLPANVAEYGSHATETPLPLTDKNGTIVFPGFPADVLAQFRVYSMFAQLLLWGVIGIVFAPLAEKVVRNGTHRAEDSRPLGEPRDSIPQPV